MMDEKTTLNRSTTLTHTSPHGWQQINPDDKETDVRVKIRCLIRDVPYLWRSVERISPLVETTVMDVLQQELDDLSCPDGYRTACVKCLRALSKARNIVPSSFSFRNVAKEGINPVCGGGFSDIWKGRLGATQVCLKVLRFSHEKAREKLLREFCQEALLWRQLRHPNILPFLGVSENLFAPSYCLISPWMVNGNIMSYLEAYPDHDRLTSLVQVAKGMKYLHNHDPPIIHADIRGANILVMDDLSCCLADFGLSLFAESRTLTGPPWTGDGCIRWLAPEYMDAKLFNQSYLTARDVYAYGCTVIEIFTGEPPFSNIWNDAGVIHEVLIKQILPPRPPADIFPDNGLWELVIACLSPTSSQRPNAEKISEILAQLQTTSRVGFEPFIITGDSCPSHDAVHAEPNLDDELLVTQSDLQDAAVIATCIVPQGGNSDQEASADINLPGRPEISPNQLCLPGSESSPIASGINADDRLDFNAEPFIIDPPSCPPSMSNASSAPPSPTLPSSSDLYPTSLAFSAGDGASSNEANILTPLTPNDGSNGGLLSPLHIPRQTRNSVDSPGTPSDMSDASSAPPSPTLSSPYGPYPTTLPLRENQPEVRFNVNLPSPDSPIRNRKASIGTLTSTDESTFVAEYRSEKSGTGSGAHSYTQYDASRSPFRERSESAPPEEEEEEADKPKEKGKRTKKSKKDDEKEAEVTGHREELVEQDANSDPTPFRFKPYELAHMLDPKNLDTLGGIGGTSGLLRGLGSDNVLGLGSGPGHGDGQPGAGESASQRHDPEKEVPAITVAVLGNVHSTHASDIYNKAAFAASLDERRRVYGPNVLPERRSKSLLQLMWTALKDKVLILLSIAAVVSLALGFFQDFGVARDESDGPPVDWVEGVAIMVAIMIVVVVGSLNDWQKERQFKTLNERKEERGVKVIRDGVEKVIDIKDVVVGDIALLEPGEIVPCDGLFLGGHNVWCDESGATGESDAIKKATFEECMSMLQKRREETGNTADLVHTDCFIVSGSKVLEGVGKYVVVAVGTKSFNGRIMMALRGGGERTPLQLKLNYLAELIAKLGSLAGLILFTALMIRFFVQLGTNDPVRTANEKGIAFVNILIISVTLIVVAVPEGLPLAVTLALAFATKRMTYENLLVRVLGSCETMATASVVCTDKTGTLTQNVMTVVAGSVGVHAKFVRQLEENQTRTNVGEEEPGHRKHPNDFSIDQSQLNDVMTPALRSLFNEAIAVNSTAFQDVDAESGETIFVGSKTETALLKFAQELGWADFKKTRDSSDIVQMIPFSSERKAMGVVVKMGEKKWRFYVKGASEILSRKCTHNVVVQKPGSASPQRDDVEVAQIDDHSADNIARTIIFYANQTLRTIALCYRDFDVWPPSDAVHDEQNEVEYASLAHDLTLIGITGIEDPLRDSVRDAVAKCHKAGVTVKMCTGDNVLTARSIASQCGIYTSGGIIMEGPIFRKLERNDMLEIVPRLQVLARSSPEDKKLLVETLKSLGEIVGVTGDGTNDGPALKTAHVGFSMGIAGTEVAKEASDIILMDDNFSSIVKAIIWGRCVNDAVRKFLQFQISTNITAVVITFVTAVASVDEEPVLTAVQLLWINIIMDTFAALALATDPATEKLLDRKPDKKTAPLFSADMYKMILFQSIYQIIISLVFHFLGLRILGLESSDHNNTVVQTLVFNAFVFAQIFNSVNCRRLDRKLNIFEGITKNYYFMGITLIEVGVQVLIVFVGGAAFQVTRVGGREWGISLALGVVSIPLGIAVRLMPTKPFEKVFKKLGLLGRSEVLPTKNADTEGWTGAITVVRDNLGTFANLRGGRVRSSSFVVKSRRATLSDDQGPMRLSSLLTMAPTMMAGAVAAGHSYIKPGNLSDPAHNDPSVSSAALWEGKLQLHPDTPKNDPAYRKFGGEQNIV